MNIKCPFQNYFESIDEARCVLPIDISNELKVKTQGSILCQFRNEENNCGILKIIIQWIVEMKPNAK